MSDSFSNVCITVSMSAMAVSVASAEMPNISVATEYNWRRLGVERETRLVSRANKTLSTKRIIPVEYFSCSTNVQFVTRLVELSKKNKWEPLDVVVAVAVQIVQNEGLWTKSAVQHLFANMQYKKIDISEAGNIENGEDDLLGGVYQALLSEGERNLGGIYYTNRAVAEKMTRPCPLGDEVLFLDPCCGGGMIFRTLKGILPTNIYGIDRDPIAVFIAKINLIRWFSSYDFEPNIFCADYLNPSFEQNSFPVFKLKYDVIVTNPPWGAGEDTEESFALFYKRAFSQLKKHGLVSFLFPEAVMSVATHYELRKFIMSNGALRQITQYTSMFSGVATKFVGIVVVNESPLELVDYDDSEGRLLGRVDRKTISIRRNLSFDFITKEQADVLMSIERSGALRLEDTGWALGVVTGDNKNKLSSICKQGMEPIYTGKEVERYVLSLPKKFISFDRTQMQQAAKDEFYRAKEKLIYRFICSDLRFSYDDSGALTLNSANVLIPCIEGMGIKTALAFLNSEVINFYYKIKFGGVKVLKSNLMQLPFPRITETQNVEIENLVNRMLKGEKEVDAQIQDRIINLYGLTQQQIKTMKENLYGKVN